MCQGPEKDLDQDCEKNNGYTIVVYVLVEKSQEIQKGLGNYVSPSKRNGPFEIFSKLFQDTQFSGSEVQGIAGRDLFRRV